jgi:hypothetical protein
MVLPALYDRTSRPDDAVGDRLVCHLKELIAGWDTWSAGAATR